MAPDRESLKRTIAALRTAFPDLRYEVQELPKVEDKMVARGTLRGTGRGKLLGM